MRRERRGSTEETDLENMTIGGAMLKEMFLTGAALLEKNRAYIDSLNVFPVPDGDTGTNMSMTMQSAVKEIQNCKGTNVSDIAAAASLGALKGARGNSGVILSQILRGFARALSGKEEMAPENFAAALMTGTEAAYKAVMKPKEGTMLTVARMMAEAVAKEANEGANLYKLIDVMIDEGERALRLTPELLPVLKEAGVVDSGGKGLVTILRGFKMVIDGEDVDEYVLAPQMQDTAGITGGEEGADLEALDDIEFGYCTEFFIINLRPKVTLADIDKLRDFLTTIGDCVLVIGDLDLVKVHVHTNRPDLAMKNALKLGELDSVKVENMVEQNRVLNEKRESEKAKMKEYGIGLCVGKFAENVTTEGICLYELPVGTKLKIGETLHEVTQIGKKCHAGDGCEIAKLTGKCIMPKEGIFTRVLKGGIVRAGDEIVIEK